MDRFSQLENDLLRLRSKVAQLERIPRDALVPGATGSGATLGAVLNFLRNGDLSFSENHYNDAPPPSGADDEKEAAHFYTHTAGTTALVEGSAQALASNGHTVNNPAGAADPQWDRTNGALQWGSTKSIDCPLPRKMAQPSKLMYVGFVARKRTAGIVIPAGLRLGIGFHDNTAGQRKYLEGGQFTLTAAVVNTPAATTSRKYKIIATTDWGETYESNEVTLAGAPSDASYVTNFVYVRLEWTKVIGVTRYDIYRLTGATYVLAGQIFDGKTGFNEMNNYLAAAAGYPVTSGTNARAYVEIDFDDLTTDWQGYVANVPVPQTYNSSLTTDKQWLRLTLSQALAAGSEQGIEIDKLYVSWNYGNFAPAPEDSQAKQDVDTAATSGTQGGAGTGGSGPPPDPGEGGRCVWWEELVQCYDPDTQERFELPASEVTLDHCLVSVDLQGRPFPCAIEEILDGWASRLHVLAASDGSIIRSTGSHPVIVPDNWHGRRADLLRRGDRVLTLPLGSDHALFRQLLYRRSRRGRFRVRIFRLASPTHLFVAGGIVSHNVKLIDNQS